MATALTIEQQETLSYLRRRARESLIEEHGEHRGMWWYRQRFGSLEKIRRDFQGFMWLSGRHFDDVAERIREMARTFGFSGVDVVLLEDVAP